MPSAQAAPAFKYVTKGGATASCGVIAFGPHPLPNEQDQAWPCTNVAVSTLFMDAAGEVCTAPSSAPASTIVKTLRALTLINSQTDADVPTHAAVLCSVQGRAQPLAQAVPLHPCSPSLPLWHASQHSAAVHALGGLG